MAGYNGEKVLDQVRRLVDRSRHVGSNVTLYTGPELGRLAEGSGQRNVHGGYNWDTRVGGKSFAGDDPLCTFNCPLLVSTKNRTNHHVRYMWGKMYLERIDSLERFPALDPRIRQSILDTHRL